MYLDRVARGARWLDKKDPAWFTKVNPDTLNWASDSRCVVGQVFGSFHKKVVRPFGVFMEPGGVVTMVLYMMIYPPVWCSMAFAFMHGFAPVSLSHQAWADAWEGEIQKRERRQKMLADVLYVPVEWVGINSVHYYEKEKV